MNPRLGQSGPVRRGTPVRVTPDSAIAPPDDVHEVAPPGTPRWITPALIALTKKIWNPRYSAPLSTLDAVTILLNTGRLFGVLARE